MSKQDEGATQTLIRDGEQLRIRSQKIAIEVTKGPDKGLRKVLPGPEVRIGSGKGCDVELKDSTVSRQHLTLRIDEVGLRVLDAGSRNASFLDGVRVRDAYAQPGSTLELGKTTLSLRLSSETIDLPLSRRTQLGGLVGSSVPMRRMFSVIEQIAPTDTTVLIEGETGSGKELVAEALHEGSERADEPFVVLDCSSVSASLIESELFGHVKGSFTGALADRMGAFENADGGTLFLDEIGELPLELQPKLLRVLESREVRRIGSDKSKRVDVRIIAATNRSLADEVEAGRFREDLYYRLAVVRLSVPPLRDRMEDIPFLVSYFEKQLTRPGLHPLSDPVVRSFQSQRWPGNVRELRNAVETAMTLGAGAQMPETPAAPSASGEPDLSVPLAEAIDGFTRSFVLAALKKTGGNATAAAELVRTNRKFIQRAIKRYRLRDYLTSGS